MTELAYYEEQELDENETLINIEIGIIYCITRHRYSWYGYPADSSFRYSSIHTNLSSAISYAENNREKGASFTITEEPCILLQGLTKRIYIYESPTYLSSSNYKSPFILSTKNDELFVKIIINELQNILRYILKNCYVRESYNTTEHKLLKITNNQYFKKYNSVSVGGGYYLKWEDKTYEMQIEKLKIFQKILATYQQLLKQRKFV